MRVYKLAATVAATTNAIASLTFVKNGKIVGVKWSMTGAAVGCKTDASGMEIELSFQAASFIGTTDTAGPIDQIGIYNMYSTSGNSIHAVNQHTPMNLPVALGEKIYLNSNLSGTYTAKVTCFLYVEE